MAPLDPAGFAFAALAGLLVLGLCVGSFLNVVIHRLPIMLMRSWRREAAAELGVGDDGQAGERFNLAVPRSRCPTCGAPIKAWNNIPIFSWLRLRGRCPDCVAAISARYPLVRGLADPASPRMRPLRICTTSHPALPSQPQSNDSLWPFWAGTGYLPIALPHFLAFSQN